MNTVNNENEMYEENEQNEEQMGDAEDVNSKPMRLFRKFAKVGWLLARYGQQKRRDFGPMGDPHRGQGRILALLKLQPGISQRDLAYLLGMRPQSVGELLAKLEKAGLVERTQSETDKRVVNVKLTEAGAKAAEKRVDANEPFAALSEEEQAILAGYLDRIAASLKEQLGDDEDEPRFGPGFGRPGWGGPGRGRGMGRGEGRGEGRRGPGFGPDGHPGQFYDPRTRMGGRRGWKFSRWQVSDTNA